MAKKSQKLLAQPRQPAVARQEPQTAKLTRKKFKHPLVQPTIRKRSKYGTVHGKVDCSRVVRWPRYVRLQRQKRILLQRLRVPPPINQFSLTLDKNNAARLFKFLAKYKPETETEKKTRLRALAEQQTQAQAPEKASTGTKNSPVLETKAPSVLKYGLNHITDLIEIGKAQLVVFCHDVDPIELVVCLPTLCRRKNIPYCIVKSKSRLGRLVHQKRVAALAVDSVRREDQAEFAQLCQIARDQFNDNPAPRRLWGGSALSVKSERKLQRQKLLIDVEDAKKTRYNAAA